MLKGLKGDERRTPEALKLMRYIIGSLVYGGKVSDTQDQMISMGLLETMITPVSVEGTTVFNLTGLRNARGALGSYCMPLAGSVDAYLAHCNKFPAIDEPEVFGIHLNAKFALANKEGESVLAKILEYLDSDSDESSKPAPRSNKSAIGDNPAVAKRLKTKVLDVESKLPDPIPVDAPNGQFRLPASTDGIVMAIHQEAQRYNSLIKVLQERTAYLTQCLLGETIMDPEAEQELQLVACDQTPPQWLAHSYPGSKNLPTYVRNLQERVEYIGSLVDSLQQGPASPRLDKFWLPGFFSPASFLALLLQHEARQLSLPVDAVTFKYSVTSVFDDGGTLKSHSSSDKLQSFESSPKASPRERGYFIGGLTLVSASWNRRMRFMEDLPLHPKALSQPLPMILLQVVKHSESTLYEVPSSGASTTRRKFSVTEDPVRHGYEIFDKKGVKYHMTPLYVTSDRGRLAPALIPGFVCHIPLRLEKGAKSTPFWLKRGTALVCHLED